MNEDLVSCVMTLFVSEGIAYGNSVGLTADAVAGAEDETQSHRY